MPEVDVAENVRIDEVCPGVPGARAAIVSAERTLSYAAFDFAVSRLAMLLRTRGVKPDECVPVMVPRSPELVVAVHAILRAGGAYVPIDPGYPSTRIQTVIKDCAARLIVAGSEFRSLAGELAVDLVEPTIIEGEPVKPVASPADLAYVIYTSGSTGQPKGVMVEHRSVVNRLRWMQRCYPLGADDVILQKTPATFDVSVWELLWWSMAGAGLAVLEPEAERDPRKIIAAVERHRVTVLHFVPSMLGPFLNELDDQPGSVGRLRSLRTVFCSGEALTPALVERFNRAFGATGVPRLVNLYGPTEATVDVSYFDCPAAGPVKSVPIGKPIDNTMLLVLDRRGDHCPIGVAGELNIAGVGLARGYRGREELTEASFVADDRVLGGRRYRTGDIARWRADGNLEFLGRLDDQVKVRGNRVNLGEVQVAMESCPGVRSAVVVAEPSDTHGTHLIGYFVGALSSTEEVRRHLGQHLPAFMVPTSFVKLDVFPLTMSGKVDRLRLPSPGATDRSAVSPRNATEAVLAEAFASVLGVEAVGVHANFFGIGGDSMLALAVRTEAEKRGVVFDIDDLFAHPTVAQLAECTSCPAPDSVDGTALVVAEDAFPATALQLGMLFHASENAESPMYKDVFRYRVAMPWESTAFSDAVDRLIARHPALRSSFDLSRLSTPTQVVSPRVPSAFDSVTGADDVIVREYMTAQHMRHYDPESAPLYSLRAFVRDEAVDLVFAFHHAILDGWSVANLMRELLHDYLFHVGVEVPPIDSETHSTAVLAEYVRLEKSTLEDSTARRFWLDALAGSHATTLAPDGADLVDTVLIPQWLQDAAGHLAESRELPLRSVLLSAHCLALQRLSGETDITTGLVTHGRPGSPGAERTAGLFLNTIPIRIDRPADSVDVVDQVVRFERASHRYRRFPLQAIQAAIGRPPFDTAFNFVNYSQLGRLAEIRGVELLDLEVLEHSNLPLLATAGIDPRTRRLFLRVDGAGASEYATSFVSSLTTVVRLAEQVTVESFIGVTSTGTRDADARPHMPIRSGPRDPSQDAPRSPAEEALGEVFASVLGVDSVDIHDDFFTIGGDSILALIVRSRAEKRGFGFDIEELYARPTVAELAASSSRPRRQQNGVTEAFALLPLIDRAALHDAEDAFPATALQLGMLFHSMERTESTMYKDVFRYRVVMPWRANEFAVAFESLVRRHPALRSSFELQRHSLPVQIVRPTVPIALDMVTAATDLDVDQYIADRHAHHYDLGVPLYSLRAFVRDGTVDLVFAFHHAILDGWSVANLMRELVQDYLFRIGIDVPPVDDKVHSATMLAESVRLERAAVDDPANQEFWRRAMAGSHPTALESHVAHEAPTTTVPAATALLPEWLQNSAARLAKERGLPMKSLLLAVHCLTLQRLCGADDITTGLVTHGRPARDGAEVAAGLFLNTIPVRFKAKPMSWLEAVEEVARFERTSHRHRRYPLQAMQADAGRPLFTVVFDFIAYHVFGDVGAADGIEVVDVDARERTNYALWVTALSDPRTGRLSLRVTGDPAAVTASQTAEFASSFLRVLAAVVRSPDQPVDLSADDLAVRDVAQLVAERAAAEPEATALVADTASWTYAELERGANRIAAALLSDGMPPGARIGVMLDRSPELIVTVLGVMKAGAAVVPLDVGYPRSRIDLMIERAKPFRVITDIDEVRALVGVPATVTLPAIDPDDVAYVLFTSGSTGEPKGVAMPHRSLHNLITWQNRRPSGAAGGSTLQFFPMSFDVSFQEVFSTLCGGGTLRIVPDAARRDLRALSRLVAHERIERVFLTCVALQAFAEAVQLDGTRPESLRVVINVGEQLRITPEIRRLCAENPDILLENHYGPTETHEVASHTLSGSPADFPALPPIGRAIDGAVIHLLGPDLRPVPPGAKGEIFVGGRCLAIGYEGRPDLTAERFVTVGKDGERLYQTGDLGAQLPSGDVVYLGRVDTQTKVRGFRIECAEVELAVMNLTEAAIEAVAVVARDIDGADAVLVAYLIGDDKTGDLAAIRSRLRKVLPAYMIPTHFQWIDEFPLTPSGKRDDQALRELPLAAARSSAGTVSSHIHERAVADIMAEFAGGAQFAPDTNFFDAGGTSIGAMRVVMAIARSWGVDIPLDEFVIAPTAAHIAGLIREGGPNRAFDPVVPLQPVGARPPLFLVHPIGGNVLCYLDLVKHLPKDQPVYALQAVGAEPGMSPLRSMSKLAASYVAAIRRVRPQGPYHVGGWSFGGYVAIEIARQLGDDELASLILLDTTALDGRSAPMVDERELLTWFFGELMLESHGVAAANLMSGLAMAEAEPTFDSALHSAIEAGIAPAEGSPQLIRRLYEIFRANYEATLSQRHQPLDRDITLLRSAEGLPAELVGPHRLVGSMFTSPTNGWDVLEPRSLRVVSVAGNHLSMMSEPHVSDVAAKLSAELTAIELVLESRR